MSPAARRAHMLLAMISLQIGDDRTVDAVVARLETPSRGELVKQIVARG